MDEYISRETLLKAVEKMDRLDKETKTKYEYDKEGYILLIQNAPASDVVEVKHGEWIYNCAEWGSSDYSKDVYYKCSICGKEYEQFDIDEANYCPNCGAKMDGERRDT